MSLEFLDTIIDEEFRDPPTGTADEGDVDALATSVDDAVAALSLTFLTGYDGFPQYADKVNFVDSDQQVTNYFLTSNGGGDPFPAGGVATDLYVGTDQIFLCATSNEDIIVGRIGGPSGDVALVIALDETVVNGFVTGANLWLALFAPITHEGEDLTDSDDTLDLSDLVFLGSDFTTATEVPFENFSSVPSGQDAFAMVAPTSGSADVELLVTGFNTAGISTVNVSTTGLGSGAQHIEPTESLRVDFVSGADLTKADTASEVHDANNIDYDDHVGAVEATFEIEQVNPNGKIATCSVFAYKDVGDVQGGGFPGDALTGGTLVEIDVEDVVILDAAGNDITAAWLARADTTIVADGEGVKITGLRAHEQVQFTTDNEEFERFTVTNTSGTKNSTFDVGAIEITTITGGADTEYAELGSHIIYQDDGPTIAASDATAPILTVDDSDLTTDDDDDFSGLFDDPDYGADGEGSIDYTLGVSAAGADSGLTDTATGEAVLLRVNGSGEVEGYTETSDDIVFVISVDSDGNVTLDQQRAIVHDDNPDPDDEKGLTSADLITLTATVHDSEAADANDSASATVEIGDSFKFKDDGPVITPQDPVEDNNLLVDNTNGDSDSSSYGLDPGEDGLGSFTIVGPEDTSGDFQWTYDDTDHDAITGTYKGSDLYSLVLQSDGTYTFTMLGELPSAPDKLDVKDIKAGGPNTNFIDVGTLSGTDFVRISGFNGDTPSAINESHAFVGVSNGNLDAGESMLFELKEADGDPILFEGLKIGTKSAQGGNYTWIVTLEDDSTITSGGNVFVGKNGILTVNPDTGGLMIKSIEVTKVDGSALKIGLGDIEILRPPGDAELDFGVRLTDGDGDWTDASFTVGIDGDLDGDVENPISLTTLATTSFLSSSLSTESHHVTRLGVSTEHHTLLMAG